MALQIMGTAPSLVEGAATASWYPTCHITYTRDTWVRLLHPLSDYAADEAKLLCQASPDTWVAWVPDHGQAVLNKSDFFC